MPNQHTCTTVSLLRRPITNGRLSLYLDFYPAIRNPETMQLTRREYLGIYIFAKPRNEMERDFNRQMLENYRETNSIFDATMQHCDICTDGHWLSLYYPNIKIVSSEIFVSSTLAISSNPILALAFSPNNFDIPSLSVLYLEASSNL